MSSDSAANCVYDFRCNQDMFDSVEEVKAWCKATSKKWTFQLEQGAETGYKHYQGRVSLIKRKRKTELLAMLRENDLKIPNYLEPTSKTVATQGDLMYVMKIDTRTDGPWSNKDKVLYMPRQFRGLENRWKPFQQTIIDKSAEWEPRCVNIVIDAKGNLGKTALAGHMDCAGKAICLPQAEDAERLVASVCDMGCIVLATP